MNPINTAGDGTIFINCLKPVGKALNYLKGKGIPPTITVLVLTAVAAGGILLYCYKRTRGNCYQNSV